MKLLKKSASFLVLLAAVSSLKAAEGILDYNRFMRDIEPIITTTTFAGVGASSTSCLSCHGDTSHAAYATYPLVLGQSRDNFTQTAQRIDLNDPDTSLLLQVPLALAAGGTASHAPGLKGSGEQFPNTQDHNYRVIQQWITDATQSSVGARVSRSEAYPNPFRFDTKIVYILTTPAIETEVSIFSMEGRLLRRYPGTSRVGANYVTWDGRDSDLEPLPTGVYFYSIKARFSTGTYVHKGSCVYTP